MRNTWREWPAAAILCVTAAATAIYFLSVRPWLLTWGATEAEASMHLPGDELVPASSYQNTRALTVDAPPQSAWPWLAQIGQDRGGFYSYTWLENLVFADIHNSGTVRPKWQQPQAGDFVPLTAQNWPLGMFRREKPTIGCTIDMVHPPNVLVLRGWGSFNLMPAAEGKTRFIVRGRNAPMPGWGRVLMALFFDPVHFAMERRMMRTIQRLAEGRPGPAGWVLLLSIIGFCVAAAAGVALVLRRRNKRPWLILPVLYSLLVIASTSDLQSALVGFTALALIIAGCLLFRRWWWAYIIGMWMYAHAVLFAAPDAFIVFGLAFLAAAVFFIFFWGKARSFI